MTGYGHRASNLRISHRKRHNLYTTIISLSSNRTLLDDMTSTSNGKITVPVLNSGVSYPEWHEDLGYKEVWGHCQRWEDDQEPKKPKPLKGDKEEKAEYRKRLEDWEQYAELALSILRKALRDYKGSVQNIVNPLDAYELVKKLYSSHHYVDDGFLRVDTSRQRGTPVSRIDGQDPEQPQCPRYHIRTSKLSAQHARSCENTPSIAHGTRCTTTSHSSSKTAPNKWTCCTSSVSYTTLSATSSFRRKTGDQNRRRKIWWEKMRCSLQGL